MEINMSSGDSEKTVFRQPSVDGDRTIIRPMPGGRGGVAQPATSQQPAEQLGAQRPPPEPPRQQEGAATYANNSDYFSTNSGLNPLVNAASTLIAVFEKTRQSVTHPNVGGLHQRLVSEIKSFEKQAKESGIKPEVVLAARYALCTSLDEAVLNTPWGSESAWPQRTLLSVFHNETSGGEKFFLLLDKMKEQPSENLYMLELMYILLSLGFEGKFRVIHRGRDMIEKIRDDLFTLIRRLRGDYERELSPKWHGLGVSNNTLAQFLPMWVIASIIGAVLMLGYSGFRVWLYQASSPVVAQLDDIADMKAVERATQETKNNEQ